MLAKETPMKYAERRGNSLKNERAQGWDDQYRELSTYIEPFRSRFCLEDTNKHRANRNSKILSAHGSRASKILAAGLMTGLTSPARPWFNLQTPDPDLMKFKPVKQWLDGVEQRIYAVFNASNYYQVLPQTYRDIGVFGIGPTSIVFDRDDIIRCRGYSVGEYYVATDYRGRVNVFYREYKMTVAQLVEEFGLEKVDRKVVECYDKGDYEVMFTVCHLIEPNDDKIKLGMSRGRPYRNLYWMKERSNPREDVDSFLEARGMYELPITAPRWDVISGDSYGIGPGFDALPDVKQLQALQRRKLDRLAKANNPPMRASNDLKNNRTSTLAGDVTYTNGVNSTYEPLYQVDGNIQALAYEIQEVKNAIDQFFYVDTFLMISSGDKRMTATEVAERQEEKLIQLGPTLTRLKDEKLDIEIKMVYNILKRKGLIPPPPQEILELGDRFEIEYISLLAQAQKAVTTTSIERAAAFASSMAAEHPDARHRFNGDAAVQRYANDIGAPPGVIRSDEEVRKMQKAEQEAAQAQQNMEMMQQAGATAQSLASTNMTGENAFSALAGL